MGSKMTARMTTTKMGSDGECEHDWCCIYAWTACYPIEVPGVGAIASIVAFEVQRCPSCLGSQMLASLGDERVTVRVRFDGEGLPDMHDLVAMTGTAIEYLGQKRVAARAVMLRNTECATSDDDPDGARRESLAAK